MLRKVLPWLPTTIIVLLFVIGITVLLLDGIAGVAAWYLLQTLLPVIGFVFLLAIALYALIKRRFSRTMGLNMLVSAAALLPILMLLGLWPVAYPANRQRTEPAATVRLPADVPLKVGWGGDDVRMNYHASSPDQRWAYDFLVEPYLTGSTELSDYGCYGVPVVAPTAGRITAAHDGEPEQVPGQISNNYTAPLGNHVVIELPTGTYLLIAHMRQGSVAVQVGDMVEEGQPLGECGNSGNTSEPHIHIHHQLQDPADFPVNFANGLPLYFRDHDGPPMPEGGISVENGEIVATGVVVQHQPIE